MTSDSEHVEGVMALRWQQAGGKRHALDAPFAPRPGEEFRAICGVVVTPGKRDFVELGGKWLDGTCWDCDAVWREMAGMAPNPVVCGSR